MSREVKRLLVAVAMATAPVARAETVEECRDTSKYPLAIQREDCLVHTWDARAIPELHALARQSRDHLRERGWRDAGLVADSAGDVASRTDTAYLSQLARSGDSFDRWFAVRALFLACRQLDVRGDSAREIATKKVLDEACRANVAADDERLRLEARDCLVWLEPPPKETAAPKEERRGLLEMLKRGAGAAGGGGLGDVERPGGRPRVRLACLQGAVRGAIELCYPDMPPLARDDYLTLTFRRHPAPLAPGKARWAVEAPGEDGPGPTDVKTVRLRAGEAVAPRGLRVVAKDGDRFLVFVPLVRGPAAPHATARAVLLALDATKGWTGEPWTSAACESGCAVPDATASGGRAKEISVTLRGAAGRTTERVRWSGERIEPAPSGSGGNAR